MKCLLIFDHLNDVVYTKCDDKFSTHIYEFASLQGFVNAGDGKERTIDDNALVQIFSPIITSQRIMSCQFGNSYTSIQCEDGINICFDEYMGYLFVSVAQEDVQSIKKYLSVCVTIVRYLCGPDVCQLKMCERRAKIATRLIDSWVKLQNNDQAVFVEAVEQLVINSDVSSVTLQILRKSVEKLTATIDCPRMHAMVLVNNKFLSLYSSQSAKDLSASDILFSTIVSQSSSEVFEKNPNTPIDSFQILLAGSDPTPSCLSHVVHVVPISEGINLLYLLEVGNVAISSTLYDAFHHLHTMQFIQIQKDVETLRPAFENLELAMKRLNDALRKSKNNSIENSGKQLAKKWEMIRKKYLDFIKSKSDEALLRAETLALGLLENLKQLLGLTSIDEKIVESSQKETVEVAKIVSEKLNSYNEFLKVKSIRNFTLGSYLEEFPGLVHFLYIDRVNHRVTAPTLDFSADETIKLTKNKIWAMIKFSRNHLQEGNLSLMWKDTVFNYSYFLWFEDSSGTPMKPLVYPTNSSKALPLPGLLGNDFYQKLKEICFPKTSSSKIRCYELFCVHLRLVTASCVLEHTRRLAATIWELKGIKAHPIDLL
ncbi:BLOC-3 complex member HPS1 isoform X2 [Tribolium castaneum]|uniref:BLOC-3 complex member HPS1 isoform X2 n=1 Tax=Tribolium castaneum TaxID=7070 RepID=UPI0001757EF6|nr:PREDICTED: Hermansky-Pudlak syndrome 1 protein homolog isoform X2 [Tribolium castaneum]|eukprot:XP_970712.2 PREDICTED: Hermansky-Pudlak syndrome 1 protein homolog isoform X2 [Tribolium castaneum]